MHSFLCLFVIGGKLRAFHAKVVSTSTAHPHYRFVSSAQQEPTAPFRKDVLHFAHNVHPTLALWQVFFASFQKGKEEEE